MSVDLSGLSRLSARLQSMPQAVNGSLQKAMQTAMTALATDIQQNKLSGQVLNTRSGRLRDSIAAGIGQNGNITNGTVGSDVPYAAIHEYGGTILRSRVKSYRIVEPQRSYLRSTMDEQSDNVTASLTEAVMGVVNG